MSGVQKINLFAGVAKRIGLIVFRPMSLTVVNHGKRKTAGIVGKLVKL